MLIGLVTHKRKSFDVDLLLIAKNSFCMFYLLPYAPVNRYGHVGTLAVERDVFRNKYNKSKFLFAAKRKSTQVYIEGYFIMCDVALVDGKIPLQCLLAYRLQ